MIRRAWIGLVLVLGGCATFPEPARVVRPDAPPEYDYLVGQELELDGRLDEAFAAYLRASEKDPDSPFLPHNYAPNTVVYTGTHDNDTAVGWYRHGATTAERDFYRRYTGRARDPEDGAPDAHLARAGLDPAVPRLRQFARLWQAVIDLPRHLLSNGANAVEILATDTLQNSSQTTVTLQYQAAGSWPRTWTTAWQSLAQITDGAQIGGHRHIAHEGVGLGQPARPLLERPAPLDGRRDDADRGGQLADAEPQAEEVVVGRPSLPEAVVAPPGANDDRRQVGIVILADAPLLLLQRL